MLSPVAEGSTLYKHCSKLAWGKGLYNHQARQCFNKIMKQAQAGILCVKALFQVKLHVAYSIPWSVNSLPFRSYAKSGT
jgi:hypothetical protein